MLEKTLTKAVIANPALAHALVMRADRSPALVTMLGRILEDSRANNQKTGPGYQEEVILLLPPEQRREMARKLLQLNLNESSSNTQLAEIARRLDRKYTLDAPRISSEELESVGNWTMEAIQSAIKRFERK